MSLKKIEEVKNSKWFSIWDLISFGVVILTSVALIIALTVGRDKSALDGFYVSYNGVQVYSYDFRDGSSVVLSEDNIEVLSEDSGGITLRFYTDGKKGFNDVFVDLNKRSVTVTDSDCSAHKDCVYTPAMTSNASTPIICTPHSFSVLPLTFDDDGII